MKNTSILAALERMWQHVVVALSNKADASHDHDNRYFTEAEVDLKLSDFITAADVPTKTSELTNDSGFLTSLSETDPTVPEWAKQPTKPTYTATEVGALPNTTSIPDSLSDLSDDSTHRTVTDSEKATWNAKSTFSGSYNDLTNKPTIPTVPTKISAFENDKNYLTSFTETDPTVPAWAKASTKPTYTASEVGALPSSGTAVKAAALEPTDAASYTTDQYGNFKHKRANTTDYFNIQDSAGAKTVSIYYDTGAIEAKGGVTATEGSDIRLKASASNSNDTGDIVFQNSSGTDIGRIYRRADKDEFNVKFSASDTGKVLLHSGNISSYVNSTNVKTASGSYTGTNSSSVTITTNFKPSLIILGSNDTKILGFYINGAIAYTASNGWVISSYLTSSDITTNSTGFTVDNTFNDTNKIYYYVAIS